MKEKMNLRVSHKTPVYPDGQAQKNEPTKSKHWAPFRHGFDKHSFISVSNKNNYSLNKHF